ncbi:uncharacterized protein T551_02788 [Pneumocystis jirovecii RU7]|uniref:GSKIP domain-containing protein n=1 Tax=Pneumocystis jirovecii (strain RU7) TaxID=1408657 RepID=A0A0W4ZHH6_PNEJ7|nr:uncharacterized protein T551_02788 [Pneumocystis jirovecii RU7]KTW27821.1 hypothetical protein T551_02788 [Pneumocystis jirovecii RU7]
METSLFIQECNNFCKENKKRLKSINFCVENHTINIVTLEEKEIYIQWTMLGWTILSIAGKSTGFEKKTYESLDTLLKNVSSKFDEQWINDLLEKLLKYENV